MGLTRHLITHLEDTTACCLTAIDGVSVFDSGLCPCSALKLSSRHRVQLPGSRLRKGPARQCPGQIFLFHKRTRERDSFAEVSTSPSNGSYVRDGEAFGIDCGLECPAQLHLSVDADVFDSE